MPRDAMVPMTNRSVPSIASVRPFSWKIGRNRPIARSVPSPTKVVAMATTDRAYAKTP